MLGNFSGVNSKGLYLRSQKEKGNCCLVFTSSIKRETRRFHVVVVQQRQRNVQNSVIHVQSCCFANLKPNAFLSFALPSPSSLVKLPNVANSMTSAANRTLSLAILTASLFKYWILSLSSNFESVLGNTRDQFTQ